MSAIRSITDTLLAAIYIILGSVRTAVLILVLWGIAVAWSNMVVGSLLILAIVGAAMIWIVMGRPGMEFFFSAREMAFYRALREGLNRDDNAFYDAFYRDSGIPREIPIVLRKELEHATGDDLDAIRPETNFADIDELDLADVIYRMERVFQIKLPRETWSACDGTFQSLVMMVVGARAKVSV